MRDVDVGIYGTPAMTDGGWKGSGKRARHLTTAFATHGFHHVLCEREGFHEPGEGCKCARCWGVCDRYHAGVCPAVSSIAELAR